MASESLRILDGQFDFSGGVDTGKVTTIKSEFSPNGLERNMVAWATNATMRGGGIRQRTGWSHLVKIADGTALWQGGFIYEPDFGNPYLVYSVGGRIYSVLLEAPYTVTDLSAAFGLVNPPLAETAFFTQGEQYLIIQAGDFYTPGPAVPGTTDAAGRTLPLFWDGTTLRRSIGITDPTPAGMNPGINEIPAATVMDYYMGRIWYAQGREYGAGDIVGGSAGTLAKKFRDAILNVTESPLCFGGDNFTVPTNAGNIRALSHTAELDTTLGQGSLYIFTRKVVYKLSVPVTRASWIALTNQNVPIQTLAQQTNGTWGDRSLVSVNGDLFYQSSDGIRSLMLSIRYFQQWGNVSLSNNLERLLQFNDRSLMRFCSGIEFDNRLWQTELPIQTPAGAAFQSIVTLAFDFISTLQTKLPPAWEGMYDGMNWLQLFQGDFGGFERAFGVNVSKIDGSVNVIEFTAADKTDDAEKDPTTENGDRRDEWFFATAAYTGGKDVELKELESAEIWIDKLFCTLDYVVEYRVDADPCWNFWHRGQICVSRSSCEDVTNPVCYPVQEYREGYKLPVTLPKPPFPPCATMQKRPANIGFQFQLRVTFKGWARVRAIIVYANPVKREPFNGLAY